MKGREGGENKNLERETMRHNTAEGYFHMQDLLLCRKLGDGLFLKCCNEVSKSYPNIEYNCMIIDNCCMQVHVQCKLLLFWIPSGSLTHVTSCFSQILPLHWKRSKHRDIWPTRWVQVACTWNGNLLEVVGTKPSFVLLQVNSKLLDFINWKLMWVCYSKHYKKILAEVLSITCSPSPEQKPFTQSRPRPTLVLTGTSISLHSKLLLFLLLLLLLYIARFQTTAIWRDGDAQPLWQHCQQYWCLIGRWAWYSPWGEYWRRLCCVWVGKKRS